MHKKFTCECCRKELDSILQPEDWFMVRDDLWTSVCKQYGYDPTVHICLRCFKKLLRRDIKLEDLKLTKHGGEIPMNFRIIANVWTKNPMLARTRIPYIERGREYLINVYTELGELDKAERCERRYNSILKLIKED